MKRFVLVAALSTSAAVTPIDALADDSIVVTGTRLSTTLDRTTSAVTVLTSDDLERRQSPFLADALTLTPGLSISRNGAFGGQTSVRLRGAVSEQTLVLIDGVVQNDASAPGAGFNAASLDVAQIDRVEILRGPQSTMWGSDAIGGVVNIITKTPAPGRAVTAFAEAGSFGTARVGFDVSGGSQDVRARLGGVALVSDGISKADERDGNPEADDFSGRSLDGRVVWTPSQAVTLEAFARRGESDGDFDSFGLRTGVQDGDETATTRETSYGAVARIGGESARLRHTITATRGDIARRNYTRGAFSFGADAQRDTLRYLGEARVVDQLRVAFGAERERSEVEGSPTIEIDGLFGLAELRPTSSLVFTAGVRRDDHSRFGDVTTSRVGVRWTATPLVSVRASWGEGFKAPTVFQLTAAFAPARSPNRDLRPESAEGWDVGLELGRPNDRMSASIGYFSLDTEDLITFLNGRYENVARAKSKGVEFDGTWRIRDDLRLGVAATRTDATNAITGRPLLRAPDWTASADLDWRVNDRLGLTLIARGVGEAADNVRAANPQGRIDAFGRADVAARYRLTERLELYGRVENVTDTRYQEVFGYGTPGRSAYAGVRVRLP